MPSKFSLPEDIQEKGIFSTIISQLWEHISSLALRYWPLLFKIFSERIQSAEQLNIPNVGAEQLNIRNVGAFTKADQVANVKSKTVFRKGAVLPKLPDVTDTAANTSGTTIANYGDAQVIRNCTGDIATETTFE